MCIQSRHISVTILVHRDLFGILVCVSVCPVLNFVVVVAAAVLCYWVSSSWTHDIVVQRD